jgi:tetratricopeptide (TPR) repeat protein
MALDRVVDLPRRRFRRRTADLITLADHARDAWQWERAAQLYRKALDRDPINPPIWVQYGHALKEAGELRDPDKLVQAEAAYRRALSLDPGVADSHLQLGHVLKLQAKSEEAKASFLRAFALDPSMPYPLDELGRLGWSHAELSELQNFVLPNDDDLTAPAHAPWRYASSEESPIAPLYSPPEPRDKPLDRPFSIGPVAPYPLSTRDAAPEGVSLWTDSRQDKPPAAHREISSTGIALSELARTPAEARARIPLPEEKDLLKALILAQRWDLDGVKEQLRDAIEEKRRVEAILTARISALEAELQDVCVGRDAALPSAIDQGMATAASPGPNIVEAAEGYKPLARFLGDDADCEGQYAHPLIDMALIRKKLGGNRLSRDDLYEVLLCKPKDGRISPHWLFDPEHYERNSAAAAESLRGPFLFYLSQGWKLDQSPHPLFDPVYYRTQVALRGLEITDPLRHFVEIGGRLGLSPHPLFDSAHYLESNPDVMRSDENPLRHYLKYGDREGRDPHPLFSVNYYKKISGIGQDDNALLYYLVGGSLATDPHPLFDTEFYLSSLGDQLPSQTTPLAHYLTNPAGMRVSPFPLFDNDYYRGQLADTNLDVGPLLLHYLKQPAEAAASPHPLFDQQFFHERVDYSQPALVSFISKFDSMGENGYNLSKMLYFREANPEFCSISYLLEHPELLGGNDIPLVHFVRNAQPGLAWSESRRPGRQAIAELNADPGDLFEPASYVRGCITEIAREQVCRGVRYLKKNAEIFFSQTPDAALGDLFKSIAAWATVTDDNQDLFAWLVESRRLAIYAIHVQDGRLRSYHKATLAALRSANYATVVVNSTTRGADKLVSDAAGLARAVMVRSGEGRDFASWIIALAHYAPALAHADHFLLLNDSLIGPFGDFVSVLASLEDDPADFKGLTDSLERDYHLQSSLLMLSKHALFSSAFLDFFLNFAPALTRDLVVKDGEIRLSKEMVKAGVAAKAMIPYSTLTETWLRGLPSQIEWAHDLPLRLEEIGLSHVMTADVASRFSAYLEDWLFDHATIRLRTGLPCNPQHWLWDGLIASGKFPFVKKDLLLINPEHIPTIIRLSDILPRNQQPSSAELLLDLVAPARDLPQSYLHLSRALVEAVAA